MRINNNISAMNTYSRLNSANNAKSGSLAKLSSGLRINRAGDDAAGLAISEKMRGQIGGLKQSVRNAQDGISLIQTAEGGLNETHSILNRMRELAVQSSNDTNTDSDRVEIQKEMNELATEMTRISNDTQFNTKELLDGKFEATFHIGANKGQNLKLGINDMSAKALNVSGSGEGKANYEIGGTTVASTGTNNAFKAGENKLNVVELDNVTLKDKEVANFGLANEKGEIVATSIDGKVYAELDGAYKTNDLKSASKDDTGTITFADVVTSGEVTVTAAADGKLTAEATAANGAKATASVDVKGLESGEYEVVDAAAVASLSGKTLSGTGQDITQGLKNAAGELVAVGNTANEFYNIKDIVDLEVDGGPITIAKAANKEAVMTSATTIAAGEKFSVKADGGIDVSSQTAADAAIKTISDAIDTVSAERSKLGATQNRLDHTINNLTATAENLSEAESRIRDVDMAEEMMQFTKNNILSQAATSMLAQANQMPQSVLQLLQ